MTNEHATTVKRRRCLPRRGQWVVNEPNGPAVLVVDVVSSASYWRGVRVGDDETVHGGLRWAPVTYLIGSSNVELSHPYCRACGRCFHVDGIAWPVIEAIAPLAMVCDACYCGVPTADLRALIND